MAAVQAGAPVTLELKPAVELPTAVADGCKVVPEGVMVVRLPPFSTETTGEAGIDEDVDDMEGVVVNGARAV